MKFRKRLHRGNEKVLDSSEELNVPQDEPSNLLSNINNQKLYLKLVGMALSMSKEVGVSSESMSQLESKLLAYKGFDQIPMLNFDPNHQLDSEIKKYRSKKFKAYSKIKKYTEPKEQLTFLKEMEREVEQIYAKEELVLALKSYIQNKKKILDRSIIKSEGLNRKNKFMSRVNRNFERKSLNRNKLYGKTLTSVLEKMQQRRDQSYEIMGKIVQLKSFWGHTFFQEAQEVYCPVYNAIFDNTQKLIITGGEDGLIKIWGRDNGLLLSNLKGHNGFINKICVSKCNRYLLSAAEDGVRFFDIHNQTAISGIEMASVFDINEIQNDEDQDNFYIMFADQERVYLFDRNSVEMNRNHRLTHTDFKLFNFKHKIAAEGANMNTFVINPDKYVFLGFTSGHIMIFNFHSLGRAYTSTEFISTLEGDDPMIHYEYQPNQFILPVLSVIKAHEDEIIEIKWNPLFSCFCTGAKKDGSCRIWDFKIEEDLKPILVKQLKIPKTKIKRKKKVYACNFVCWNSTYSHLVCSFMEENNEEESDYRGDGEALVYSTKYFEVTWEVSKSIDLSSITCIDTHPVYENIALICDSHGKLILIDIFENFIINIFEQRAYHLGHPSFCLVPSQCRFSQDGFSFIVATQYGNVSLYGYDIKDFYDVNPTEQFFETDYENFEIHPQSMKPVVSIESNIDINELSRGEFINLRKQPYENYPVISIKKLLLNKSVKISHQNSPFINQSIVEKTNNTLVEYERQVEVYRQNIEELENKRLAILYEEREERAQKVRNFIQQKINRLNEIDSKLAQRLSGNLTINASIVSNPITNRIETRTRGRGRGRPRLEGSHAQNIHSMNRMVLLNSEEQREQDSPNLYEEEYQAESELEDADEDEQQEIDNFDEEYDENDSDPVYMSRNRNRKIPHRIERRSDRYQTRNHRFGVYHVYDDSDELQNVGIRRTRRNVNEEIEDLIHEVQGQQPRKRPILQEDPENDLGQVQRRPTRRVKKEAISFEINEEIVGEVQNCLLCQINKVCNKCYRCDKFYCEGCCLYRMKKLTIIQNSSHENTYKCFTCCFKENTREESNKNLDFSKYVRSSRTDDSKEFLFVPQIGDEIAYIPEGYEEFVSEKLDTLNNKVLNMGLEGIDQEAFEVFPQEMTDCRNLMSVTRCVVKDIKYMYPLSEGVSRLSYSKNRRANRANNILLNRNRPQNSSQIPQQIMMFIQLKSIEQSKEFWVFYIPGLDYILKWQIYDDIINNNRYSKIEMYKIAEMKDYEIQFMNIKPYNPYLYPSSIWKNIIVHRGDTKNLRKPKEQNEELAINLWQIKDFVAEEAFAYRTSFSQEDLNKYIEGIKKIEKRAPDSWAIFSYFVQLEQYDNYYESVEVGMCLDLILKRLENKYYRSQDSFIKDLRHLIENSIAFNGEDSYITEMCETMVNEILFGNKSKNNQEGFIQDEGLERFEVTEKKGKIKGYPSSGKSKKNSPSGSGKGGKGRLEGKVRISKFDQQNSDEWEEEEDGLHDEESESEQDWKKSKRQINGIDNKRSTSLRRLKRNRHQKKMVIQSESEDYHDSNSKQKKAKAKELSELNKEMLNDDGFNEEKRIKTRNKSRTNTYTGFDNETRTRPRQSMRVTRSRTKQ